MIIPYITLFSNNNLASQELENKLIASGLCYEICSDNKVLSKIEEQNFPLLMINCGPLMKIEEANKWLEGFIHLWNK